MPIGALEDRRARGDFKAFRNTFVDTPRKADAHVQWIQNPNLWFSEDADDANDSVSHHWDVERL